MEGGMAVEIPGAMPVAVKDNVFTALLSDIALQVFVCVLCVSRGRHGSRCRFPATIYSKAQILISQCPSKSAVYRPCRDYFSRLCACQWIDCYGGAHEHSLATVL